MPSGLVVQQNVYKGDPPRAWIRLRFAAPDGSTHERQLLADTGSPCAVILGDADLFLFLHNEGARVDSNFGPMRGAWLQLAMPELGLTREVLGFGSEAVMEAVRDASADFAGLVGLPLLRLVEYGGDGDSFWLRNAAPHS
jgi:hypothetical protein